MEEKSPAEKFCDMTFGITKELFNYTHISIDFEPWYEERYGKPYEWKHPTYVIKRRRRKIL